MHSIDIAIQHYISATRSPALTEYMYLLTLLFNISVQSFLVMICIAVLASIRRGRSYAYLFVGALALGALSSYFLKIFFNVTRPAGGLVATIAPSFPSYHATVSTIFFVMFAYIFCPSERPVVRGLAYVLCVLGIAAVGFSRIYLGVHWFSDILGGIVLGLLVSFASMYIFKSSRFGGKYQSHRI